MLILNSKQISIATSWVTRHKSAHLLLGKLKHLSRLKLVLLSAAFAITACQSTPKYSEDQTVTVFILAGQSNMAGEANLDDRPPGYPMQYTNIELFDFTQDFDYMKYDEWIRNGAVGIPPSFVKPQQKKKFGLEIGFANILNRTHPTQKFVLIKWALGGTSQLEWSPDWNASNFETNSLSAMRGPLFDNTIAAIESVALEKPYRIEALLWFQGEADTKTIVDATSYGERMKSLIDAFRNELESPQLKVLIGKVNPNTERHSFVSEVHSQMYWLASSDENATLVSADGISKAQDGVHYDAPGTVELGERFAKTWIELAKK